MSVHLSLTKKPVEIRLLVHMEPPISFDNNHVSVCSFRGRWNDHDNNDDDDDESNKMTAENFSILLRIIIASSIGEHVSY